MLFETPGFQWTPKDVSYRLIPRAPVDYISEVVGVAFSTCFCIGALAPFYTLYYLSASI